MNAFFPDICGVVCLRVLAIIGLFRLCIARKLSPFSSSPEKKRKTEVTSDEAQASIGR